MLTLFEIRNALADGVSIFDLHLKVTYYARVSTDKYDQLNSLENQITYYEHFIRENTNWTFVDGYVDEGITGTSTAKRDDFKRMIRDAKNKKFNLIITKEISRFARDTLDSIKYTRELLEYGVGVFFEYDHINTFNPDSELGNNAIWGYKKDNCKLVIVEEEAEIIRRIFDMYVNEHIGMRTIGHKLADLGYYNSNGKPFTQNTIKNILTNPKYKGYYCGNKTRVIDYHSKQRVNIEKDDWKLYEDNESVPPIVSASIWEKAQKIIEARSKKLSKDKTVYQNRYPFSGKIYCMEHNTTYRRKVNTSSGIKKKKVVTWRCSEFLKHNTKGCDGPILYDNELREIVGKTILSYVSNINVIDDLMKEYKELQSNMDFKDEIEVKQKKIEMLEKKKSKILDLILKDLINEDDFKLQVEKIVNEIHKLEDEITILEEKSNHLLEDERYLESVKKKAKELLEYEKADIDSLIYEFLEKIEVYKMKGKDFIKLRIILNTGDNYSISFKNKTHPSCSYYTYDPCRC